MRKDFNITSSTYIITLQPTSNNSVVHDSTTNKHYNYDKYTNNHIADDSSDNNDDDYPMDTKSSTTHRSTIINGKHADPQKTTNQPQEQQPQQQQQENSNRPVNPTSNSHFFNNNNNIKSDFMNLSSTKRYSSKTQFSEFGSQSLPASGRLSPTLKSTILYFNGLSWLNILMLVYMKSFLDVWKPSLIH
ncbi:unnamed protein product [Trichobilharzia regenti]|nr:unnamed protein product [Trichobilharzia regenti]